MRIVSVAYMALIGDGLAREHAHLEYHMFKEEKIKRRMEGKMNE